MLGRPIAALVFLSTDERAYLKRQSGAVRWRGHYRSAIATDIMQRTLDSMLVQKRTSGEQGRRRDSQSEPQPVKWRASMLWRVSRPILTRSKPPGFILPCQPALADRPPAGPGWLHEIKFDGYRVIARKDGNQVRLWARTTSDYSKAFTRIRDAVAALPVDSAVLDGEAVLLRSDNTSDFEGLRSRHGQADAVLVAYDVMEVDGKECGPSARRAQEAPS